jgi:hypothetical protein
MKSNMVNIVFFSLSWYAIVYKNGRFWFGTVFKIDPVASKFHKTGAELDFKMHFHVCTFNKTIYAFYIFKIFDNKEYI